MSYIDGVMLAVPTANKAAFLEHARTAAAAFKRHGASQVVECWGDEVPEGKLNSMHTAVMRKDDEAVVFSWVLWPSKAVRDEAWPKVMSDPAMQPENNPMPFDGSRMIFGGFEVCVDE